MRIHTSLNIITIAFIISLCGFILSLALPQNEIADSLMIAALFIAAAAGIVASLLTEKLSRSKQWRYVVIGGLFMLLGFVMKRFFEMDTLGSIVKVSGAVIAIVALGYHIFQYRKDFLNSKWIWFIPFILSGCLFKLMHWPGGNIIVFASLLIIAVTTILQLINFKKLSSVQVLLLVWQLAVCACIVVFYFRYIKWDSFIIGYLFTWLALIHILLHNEKNSLENSEYR